MHARVLTLEFEPDQIEEAVRLFHESVLPAAHQQKGFRAGVLLTDAKNNRAVSITVWETEEDLLANEESGYFREQLAKVAPLVTGPPMREVYEIGAYEEATGERQSERSEG